MLPYFDLDDLKQIGDARIADLQRDADARMCAEKQKTGRETHASAGLS